MEYVRIVSSYKPTEEMINFFKERTEQHINRVRNNLNRLSKILPSFSRQLLERGVNHDKSKYSDEELVPYIHLTWFHKCKNDPKLENYTYPEGVEEQTDKAWIHHEKNNRHHIGYHSSPSDMNIIDLAELVCDCAAMSQELNSSLKDWIVNNTLKNDFTNKQKNIILKLTDYFKELG